jgi:hypothetical protein
LVPGGSTDTDGINPSLPSHLYGSTAVCVRIITIENYDARVSYDPERYKGLEGTEPDYCDIVSSVEGSRSLTRSSWPMRRILERKTQPCVVYPLRVYIDGQWKISNLVAKDKEKFVKMEEKVGLTKNKKLEWRTEVLWWK